MRNIRLLRRKQDYDDYMFAKFFPERLVEEHPFYRNLIQFVLDAKAPIAYWPDDLSERNNMSIYYNFLMFRDEYYWESLPFAQAQAMESLYALHEFCHMLFYYPYDLTSVSEREFTEIIVLGEFAASNETEILVHYREPRLRSKIFPERRLFVDMLRERDVPQPTPQNLFELRRLIIETSVLDRILFTGPEDQSVLATFKSYQSNRRFCKDFFDQVRSVEGAEEYYFRFLTRDNYERVLANYHRGRLGSQEEYERLVFMNMRLAFAVLGLADPPRTFEECFEKVRELDGRAMFSQYPERRS